MGIFVVIYFQLNPKAAFLQLRGWFYW